MEILTRKEEGVMQIFWKIKKGFVKDVIEEIEKNGEDKPPYNTISSIVRILENKKFVGYKAYGKTYEYFPLISKQDYRKLKFKNMRMNYFDNSYERIVSFIAEEENLSAQEIKDIIKIITSKKSKTND